MEELKRLANLYDNVNELSFPEKIALFLEMRNNEFLSIYAVAELNTLGLVDYPQSICENSHNANYFHDPVIVDKLIANINKYNSPHKLKSKFPNAIKAIENYSKTKLLFSAIYTFANSNSEIYKRLEEELNEIDCSICYGGILGRLLNVIRGFDDRFNVTVCESYMNRTRIYHKLNSNIDFSDYDGIVDNIKQYINGNKNFFFQFDDICTIMNEYSTVNWFIEVNGDINYKRY